MYWVRTERTLDQDCKLNEWDAIILTAFRLIFFWRRGNEWSNEECLKEITKSGLTIHFRFIPVGADKKLMVFLFVSFLFLSFLFRSFFSESNHKLVKWKSAKLEVELNTAIKSTEAAIFLLSTSLKKNIRSTADLSLHARLSRHR